MQRWWAAVGIILLTGLVGPFASAQTAAQPGDPPIASLISVSAPDENGLVTISGAAGAVFPAARVAVRNLYTEEVVTANAGLTGAFTARIFGPGSTPFWISPAQTLPAGLSGQPGSLPGGPGTIVYGSFPEARQDAAAITQLIVDGQLGDWELYPDARLLPAGPHPLYALRNAGSLYLALPAAAAPTVYNRLAVLFSSGTTAYGLVVDPRLAEQTAVWRRISPNAADLGTIAVAAAAQADGIELRVPLSALRPAGASALADIVINGVEFLAADGTQIARYSAEQPPLLVNEVDGIVYQGGLLTGELARFTAGGPVASGAGVWTARGRALGLTLSPGSVWRMQMDVTLNAPGLPDSLAGLGMIGRVSLQPVIGADGLQAVGGPDSANGWTAARTPSGLPIDGLGTVIVLGETLTPAQQVLRQGSALTFGLDFRLRVPADLPPGLYVPVFEGWARIANGELIPWHTSGLLGSDGRTLSRLQSTRLPLVLNSGGSAGGRLLWTLFHDAPGSAGSRGLLAAEDAERFALSNRVRFNSPTYILPPRAGPDSAEAIAYPLEPYLPNMLPNSADSSAPPLIPFLFPGGRLSGQVQRPDGTVDDLGSAPFLQNRLSTPEADDRTLFGGQSQVDIYRLTTLNPLFTGYRFDQYGEYRITLSGALEDIWGNRYEGGGVYTVLAAETLNLTPGVMPGTPFHVGDAFSAALRVAPAVPADVTVRLRVYPLDGSAPVEHVISGQANRAGYFYPPDSAFAFDTPGEYVADYEARYTDAAGRLWAGSLRGAGVIATAHGTLIARGQRGLFDFDPGVRPAWFRTQTHAPRAGALRYHSPYHPGDVLRYPADSAGSVQPVLTLQDAAGSYQSWLLAALPDYTSSVGQPLEDMALRDELPAALDGASYYYFSAIRPGVSLRQFVKGRDEPGLLWHWDADNPLNRQPGAGLAGDQPGDYAFLFGGAVVRAPDAGVVETAAYAALAVAIGGDDARGPRVFPPYRGEAGGPDGGPLLTLGGQLNLFFYPTSVQPGQVLTVGDVVSFAGQVGPALASRVDIAVTDPDGETRAFGGYASPTGYYYNPADDFAARKPGVWTVQVRVTHDGLTSAGPVQPPLPQGGVPGAPSGIYQFYVIPAEAGPIPFNDTRADYRIPGGIPYNFNFSLPADWSDAAFHYTAAVPAYIVGSGRLQINGRSVSYQYNPVNLNNAFPNYEIDARVSGPHVSDRLTLTFFASGADPQGQRRYLSRTVVIQYDRLTTFD